METYAPLSKGRRAALGAFAGVTGMALLSSVLLVFDHGAETAWAGLDARLKQPDPPCPTRGSMPPGCGTVFASVAVEVAAASAPAH